MTTVEVQSITLSWFYPLTGQAKAPAKLGLNNFDKWNGEPSVSTATMIGMKVNQETFLPTVEWERFCQIQSILEDRFIF